MTDTTPLHSPAQHLIEQVARAIYNADDDRVAYGDDRWEWWTNEARAAIQMVLDAASNAVTSLADGAEVSDAKSAIEQLRLPASEVPANSTLLSITTAVDLSYLAVDTVVLSAEGNIWQRLNVDGELVWLEPGSAVKHSSVDIALPVTVVQLAHALAEGGNL